MSIQSEIDRIAAARDDIAAAIREQDVQVPTGTKLSALAGLVRQIVGKVLSVCGKGPDEDGNIALTASDVGAAASSHKHSAADITSGTLPIARGGTGATTAAGARTALGAAAASHTHTASQVTGLTASRALVSDSGGHPAVAAVTATELGYLDGVTGPLQTQINGKAASSHTHAAATTSTAGFMSTTDKSKLDGIAAGAQKNPGAATTSAAGLMSAADKQRLNAMRVWTIVVPDTAWTTETGGYKATISAPGMTVSTQLISVALSPAYMGLAESEEAARQWTYLDTAADSVVLHAAIKPGAYFGLVLAAMATANPQ